MKPTLAVVMMFTLMMHATPAHAKTFQCGAGDVGCLITAINEANANAQTNTIRLEAGTYTLAFNNDTNGANGLPSITSELTIKGAPHGATILQRVSTSPDFRLAHVAGNGSLTLDGVTFTGGRVNLGKGGALYNNGGSLTISNTSILDSLSRLGGGAIYTNGGVVTIAKSTLSGNFGSGGGGVSNDGGNVTIAESTFIRNTSQRAGGILTTGGTVHISQSRFLRNNADHDSSGIYISGGQVLITTSTFDGHVVDGNGAAIHVNEAATLIVTNSAFTSNAGVSGTAGGAIANAGTTVLINSTFARNHLRNDGRGTAIVNSGNLALLSSTVAENTSVGFPPVTSALYSSPGATTIVQNTIFARNTSSAGVAQDCTGTITSLGNNIMSTATGCDIGLQPTDVIGDPGLGTFTDNGDPGNAHFPLLSNSGAIDSGNDVACLKEDQLGQPRPRQCDIGAIEFHGKKDHDK